MDLWQETNWYAVQAKPHCENLAAASVAKLDVEIFLPKIKREQPVCGVLRFVSKALFTGYFFARFCPVLSHEAVRYARGVLRIVGNHHFPIPLEADIIDSIQGRVQADGFIRLEQKSFRPGDEVTIEHGPFAGFIGQVEREWDDGKRVSIFLEAIQQTRVLIEKRWLVAEHPN